VGRHDPADALTDDLAQARGPGPEGVALLLEVRYRLQLHLTPSSRSPNYCRLFNQFSPQARRFPLDVKRAAERKLTRLRRTPLKPMLRATTARRFSCRVGAFISAGEWLLREPPKQLYRFGEADDRSGDSPAPTVDRPQPDRSLKTAAYLARN
jgi:hypothetical protein